MSELELGLLLNAKKRGGLKKNHALKKPKLSEKIEQWNKENLDLGSLDDKHNL